MKNYHHTFSDHKVMSWECLLYLAMKTQRYTIHNDKTQRKTANPCISEAETKERKMTQTTNILPEVRVNFLLTEKTEVQINRSKPVAGMLQPPVASVTEDSPSWSPVSLMSYWSALPSLSDWEWCPLFLGRSEVGRWRSLTPTETTAPVHELECPS